MRSMLQLLGGVAVAGAVAAGATAFTATGIIDNTSGAGTVHYGSGTFTVEGASIDNVVLSSSLSDKNQIDKIAVTLKDQSDASFATPANINVAITVTGSAAGTPVGPSCTYSGSGDVFNCALTSGYWSAVTGVNFIVTDS
jgi:hypothetical protein